jgi:hypothetical protein
MPAADSVVETRTITPPVGGRTYQLLRTIEFDSYETNAAATAVAALVRTKRAPSPTALAAALKTQTPPGDNFAGMARKAAKLSIANAPVESFDDLSALIDSLTDEDAMINHTPPITVAATSNRVKEERRNVHVTAFLYAASRETDNDFHLIVGRDPSLSPELYVTMEVSGLPGKTANAFDTLNIARASYKTFFADQLPGMNYDFYHPPIPVVIEGSLFFDMSHAQGQRPGPASLKSRMPTIWEVHPVTSITLGEG